MNSEKEDKHNGAYLASAILWGVLIGMKLIGKVSMNWALVILGALWIPFPVVLVFVAAEIFATMTIGGVLCLLDKLRKLKRDRRIIRQAKAAGVWDRPAVLGGRALELKAWKGYRIKRNPGETDACLRIRYWDAHGWDNPEALQVTFSKTEEGRSNEQH